MSCRTHAYAEVAETGCLPKTFSPSSPSRLRDHVVAKAERRYRLRREVQQALSALCALAVVALPVGAVMASTGWPLATTLRHFAAAANCETARSLGLAPARQGHPGYWPWLDRDADGIACELTQRQTTR